MTRDTPLVRASDLELADAVEANLFALFRATAGALGGALEESPRLSRFHCAPPSPIFKGVFDARLAESEAGAAIAETIDWFRGNGAPFFFWWLGQRTRPADLAERLAARGLVLFEQDAPAMVADIDALRWDAPRPAGLRLDPVADERQLREWARIFVEAFEVPPFAGRAWVDATQQIGIGRAPWQLLLGTLGGEPVCCGLLFCGAGVAGLVGLGTLPAYRRQGVGSAMQLERLRIARELGYRYAVLFASEMGRSPYLKLGFRDTGRTVTRYLWRAS